MNMRGHRSFLRRKPKGIKVVAVTPLSPGIRVNCNGVSVLIAKENGGCTVYIVSKLPSTLTTDETGIEIRFPQTGNEQNGQ